MDTYMRDWNDLGQNLSNLGSQIGTATVGLNSGRAFGTINGSTRLDQAK